MKNKKFENKETPLSEFKHAHNLEEQYIHFTDDFMFSKVMSDTELCKEFLETILGVRIDGIIRHEAQKYLTAEYDTKSMRLDVYTETSITMINTEMQKRKENYIGKRTRYSGSLMDENQLAKGGDYKELKARYVVFICTSDPFKKGLCQYTFQSKCIENEEIDFQNGITDIVINLKGDLTGVGEDYRELIEYMAERRLPEDCNSPLVHKIHTEVERANRDPELRRIRMTLGEKMKEIETDSREEGIEIGEARGESRGIYVLIDTLCSMGETFEDAMKKAAEQFGKSVAEIQEIMMAR